MTDIQRIYKLNNDEEWSIITKNGFSNNSQGEKHVRSWKTVNG